MTHSPLETVSQYCLDEADLAQLLENNSECVFMWSTREAWPMGVAMSYLWANDRFWLTLTANRHRVAAIERDPRVSLCVSNGGIQQQLPNRSVTVKGRAIVHRDRDTKTWFYPQFAARLRDSAEQAEAFADLLDSPLRVVLEVRPEKWISFDGSKLSDDLNGTLSEERRGELLSSDRERLARERVKNS